MNTDRTNQVLRATPLNVVALLFGVVLIFFGFVLMIAQVFDFPLIRYTWPLFIILPGTVLTVWGLITSSRPGQGLTIAGSIVLTVGLLLSYQNLTDHFESWAYAWALVAPTSVGVAQLVYGLLHHRDAMVKRGLRLMLIGVTIFVVGAIFFEVIIGISGPGLGVYGVAMLFILAGVTLLGSALLADRGVTPTMLLSSMGLMDTEQTPQAAGDQGEVTPSDTVAPPMQSSAAAETDAAMSIPSEGTVLEKPMVDAVPQG